jgi:hypothetical protein
MNYEKNNSSNLFEIYESLNKVEKRILLHAQKLLNEKAHGDPCGYRTEFNSLLPNLSKDDFKSAVNNLEGLGLMYKYEYFDDFCYLPKENCRDFLTKITPFETSLTDFLNSFEKLETLDFYIVIARKKYIEAFAVLETLQPETIQQLELLKVSIENQEKLRLSSYQNSVQASILKIRADDFYQGIELRNI